MENLIEGILGGRFKADGKIFKPRISIRAVAQILNMGELETSITLIEIG